MNSIDTHYALTSPEIPDYRLESFVYTKFQINNSAGINALLRIRRCIEFCEYSLVCCMNDLLQESAKKGKI